VAASKSRKVGRIVRSKRRGKGRKSPSLPERYQPNDQEEFMGPLQQEYFRQKLLGWRREILTASSQTINALREDTTPEADIGDRASTEAGRLIELRSRDRARKLLSKIEAALQRIEDGTYGFCEETGEPIGISRLEARPVATLSLAAQERHERIEKTYSDD
jgi:DnaK suppressor protein